MTDPKPAALIADANVLIDFVETDIEILRLLRKHLWPVYVLEAVLAEVPGLNKSRVQELGLLVVEPSLRAFQFAAKRGGPLSARDRLCLAVAREMGWGCLTNDRPLEKACEREAIPVIRGLQSLLLLRECSAITRQRALQTARAIHRSNPAHIHQGILQKFVKKLGP